MQFNQTNTNRGNVNTVVSVTPFPQPQGIYIGVDLGLEGAVAFLDAMGNVLRVEDMVTKKDARGKSRIDAKFLYQTLSWVRPATLLAYEHCQPFGKEARTSIMSFGNGIGRTQAVIELLGIPYVEVTPQAWKAKILVGTAKDKAAALGYCEARWPGVCGGNHNRADSLLLAAYALYTSTGRI